jgi:hypothetical protein
MGSEKRVEMLAVRWETRGMEEHQEAGRRIVCQMRLQLLSVLTTTPLRLSMVVD